MPDFFGGLRAVAPPGARARPPRARAPARAFARPQANRIYKLPTANRQPPLKNKLSTENLTSLPSPIAVGPPATRLDEDPPLDIDHLLDSDLPHKLGLGP